MNIKIHLLQAKKQQYKKHLQRLSHIYSKQKSKQKIQEQVKSIQKLMAITHRLHNTSNNFKLNKIKSMQRQTTLKDWSRINCSIIKADNKKIPFIGQNKKPFQTSLIKQKIIKQQNSINKQNKNLMMRLINVRPTIQVNKMIKNNFLLTQRGKFASKINQTEFDFSSILNNSIIRVQQQKIIPIKLHLFNEQVIKIKFTPQIRQLLHEQKLYFFELLNDKNKKIQSKCFNLKQLQQSKIYIYRQKQQPILYIEIKQLYNDIKPISKGVLNMTQLNLQFNSKNSTQFCEFIMPNNKIAMVGLLVDKKNIKKKNWSNKFKLNEKQKTQGNQLLLKNQELNNKDEQKQEQRENQNIEKDRIQQEII